MVAVLEAALVTPVAVDTPIARRRAATEAVPRVVGTSSVVAVVAMVDASTAAAGNSSKLDSYLAPCSACSSLCVSDMITRT